MQLATSLCDILGPYRKTFGNPGGLEAGEPRRLETSGPKGARVKTQEPIERGLEIQEAWKLGNLEVYRLGSLGEALRTT